MRSNKIAVGAALLAAGSLVLSACGGSSSGEPSEKPATPETTSAAPAEPVKLEYWHRLPDKPEMIKISEATEEWNKDNPDIQVTATKFEGKADDTYAKITAAIKAGNAPCLAQVSYNDLPAVLSRGELMDVTKEADAYKANYLTGAWGQVSPGGKTYGLPQDVGPLVFYYDEAAFNELGLKVPTTWEEYFATAEKAKAAGKATSLFWTDDSADWFSAIEAAHNNLWYGIDGKSWKVGVTGEDSMKVAADWQKSLDSGATVKTARWNADGFDKGIKEGKFIGYIGAAWEAAFNLNALGVEKANWNVAELPGEMTGPWGGSGVVVLKGCKYPEQALKYANWLNTNLKVMASQGLVVAAKGAVPTPDNVMALYGGRDIMKVMAQAGDRLNTKWIYGPTWPAVKQAWDGSMTPESVDLAKTLETAQKESVQTLEAMGLTVAK